MRSNVLVAVLVLVPAVAFGIEWNASRKIVERHHAHHDTYELPVSATRTPVLSMAFVAVLGLMITWLCAVGIFAANPELPLAFFSAYVVVAFIMWLCIRRYKVVTYEDHMELTPFVGPRRQIRYAEITSLEWTRVGTSGSYRSIRVRTEDGRASILWGIIDLQQVLTRINRYDVLERLPELRS